MSSLYKNDLKQLKNIIIIYISFLLLSFIVTVLSYENGMPALSLYVLIFIFSIVIPIYNLQYLFDISRYCQVLALPVTKKRLFLIKYCSGLTVLLIPLTIYYFGLLCFKQTGVSNIYLNSLLLIWVYYTLSYLCTLVTCQISVDLVLQIVLFLSPILLYSCLFTVYQTFFRGIISMSLSKTVVSFLIPIYHLIGLKATRIQFDYVLVYLFYGLVLFILATIASDKRDINKNYHGFSFAIIGELIKAMIIISVSWSITALMDLSSQSIRAFIIINIIATFIGVFIVQYIYWRKIKYLICLFQAIVLSIMTLSIFFVSKKQIENYIPNDIQSVVINHDLEYLVNETEIFNENNNIKNKADIEKIVAFHENILEKKCDYGNYNIGFVYNLNNHEQVIRNYQVNYNDYQEIISNFTPEILKSWYCDYYTMVNRLETTFLVDFQELDNGSIIDQIINKSDILLFKNLLEQQLKRFEDNLNLLLEVGETSYRTVTLTDKDNNSHTFFCYSNDPLALAIKEYNKIKAN